jgi:hypothetical protein
MIIRVIVPDFGGGIEGSSYLCLGHLVFDNFGNVEICQFSSSIGTEQNVGRLEIPVDDIMIMQRF